ncbi:MAG TPA: hypothetical protein PLV57_20515 [Phycisphaerae bacterium]|nr:hypothetical protein [Phycisphaerae bacterium]
MASTQGIRAGRAFVELGVSDKLTAGLRRAQRQLRAFGEGLRSIGTRMTAVAASVLAPLGATVKYFSSAGDTLNKMAARTGVSSEALSELGFAAEQSGADLETLELGLRRMQKVIGDAADGSASAGDTLGKLGLTLAKLQGLAPEQQFALIADRLSQIQDPTLRAASAMEVFGRSGTQLLPLMQDGARGIGQLREQARALGLTVSTGTAQDAAVLNDTLNILWRVVKQGAFVVGSALAPAVVELSNTITRTVVSVTNWISQNKAVVVTVAKVAATVAAAGVAIIGLSWVVSGMAAALGGLAAVASGVGTVLGVVGSALTALLSPIGLVIAAVAALGAAVFIYSGAAGKALEWLREQFGRLHAFVSRVVTGMSDALAAGDVALAARILWLALKLAWQEGVAALNRTWLAVKRFMLTQAQQMWTGVLSGAEFVWHGLKVGWIEATAFISRTWKRFTSFLEVTWATIKNVATKTLNHIKGLFDETFDVDAANLVADQALVAAEQRIEQDKDAQLGQLQREGQQKREAEQQRHESRLRGIIEAEDEALAELDQATDSQLDQTRQQLDDARRQLADALAEAKQKREQIEAEDKAPQAGPRGLLDGLADRLEGLGDVIANKITVTGTFNPVAVQGLAAGNDAAQRTATASEQTAKHTKRLADAAVTGGLTFA